MNICQENEVSEPKESFEIKSGSFETLIKLADEGMGMTLLPYLHTLNLSPNGQKHLHHFSEPEPAREISLIYHTNELKINMINALFNVISGIVRGAIAFDNIKIIDPQYLKKYKKNKPLTL